MIGSLSFGSVSQLPTLGMAPATGAPSPGGAGQAGATDFAGVLRDFAQSTAATLKTGEAAAIAGVQGTMPLQTLVDRVLAAERSLQAAVAIRDKMVSSYLEISRMQI